MKNRQYQNGFSSVYDSLNHDIDIPLWADFIEECVKEYSSVKVKNICELACGTGSMATELARRGYGVTALDLSEDMLCIAESKSRKAGCEVRYTAQDMRSFALYSKADLFLCLLDSVNYLPDKDGISAMLERVYKYLSDGGIFIFDVNSKYKFENIYGRNSYILEEDGILCAWENYYSKSTKKCHFYLSVFAENKEGTYNRFNEIQTEYMYRQKLLCELSQKAGFSVCGVFSGFDFANADETKDERLYFVLKKI